MKTVRLKSHLFIVDQFSSSQGKYPTQDICRQHHKWDDNNSKVYREAITDCKVRQHAITLEITLEPKEKAKKCFNTK